MDVAAILHSSSGTAIAAEAGSRRVGLIMRKVTIEDISRQTGLSRGTVSRALNNRPDISVQTKQRVLEACRQLKYVPSHAARALATGRRYAIAVAVDDLRSCFAASYVRGAARRATDDGYAVHVFELGADPRAAVESMCSMAAERVDGLLLGTPLPPPLLAQVRSALENRVLVTGEADAATAWDTFAPDHAEAGRLLARHLLRTNQTDVLYVYQPGTAEVESRLAGFREVCAEYGVSAEQTAIAIQATQPDPFGPVRARLGSLRAVIGDTDALAVNLLLLAVECGRRPGRDLAVAGVGNDPIGAYLQPSLTTVDLCGEEIGRRAMEVAIQRITKVRQDAPQHTLVAPLLIQRDSTRMG